MCRDGILSFRAICRLRCFWRQNSLVVSLVEWARGRERWGDAAASLAMVGAAVTIGMSAQNESSPRYERGRALVARNELMFTLAILVANFKLEGWGFFVAARRRKRRKKECSTRGIEACCPLTRSFSVICAFRNDRISRWTETKQLPIGAQSSPHMRFCCGEPPIAFSTTVKTLWIVASKLC